MMADRVYPGVMNDFKLRWFDDSAPFPGSEIAAGRQTIFD
jgi:hypothetical protein